MIQLTQNQTARTAGWNAVVSKCSGHSNMDNIKNENPLLEIPNYMENMQWIMFLSAIILTILSIVVWKFSYKRKPICISFLVLLLLIGALGAHNQIELSKYLTANNAVSELPQDVSANFMPISLNTFERSLDSDSEGVSVYYISRTDCAACEDFEKAMTPFLEESAYSMTTYFTNSDRNGLRSKEMYTFLENNTLTAVSTNATALVQRQSKEIFPSDPAHFP